MNVLPDRIALFVCRLGWAGLSPRAPGTVGSLVAVLAAPWLFIPLSLPAQLTTLGLIFILGGAFACRAEALLGCKDPSEVVIDELLGQWVALLPVSLLLYKPEMGGLDVFRHNWQWLLLGFVLFRAFDILKPWPIKASENWLPGGFGIMLDDLIAGIFAGFLVCSAIYKFA